MTGLLDRRVERVALEDEREHEDPDRDGHVVDVVRMPELQDPLVQREQTTHREQYECDGERPEVALTAVPVRVHRRLVALRAVAAEEQESLISRVGERVHALGEHARGAGEGEADELGDRDSEVGEKRRQDGLAASVGHYR